MMAICRVKSVLVHHIIATAKPAPILATTAWEGREQKGRYHKPAYRFSDPFLYRKLTRVQLVGGLDPLSLTATRKRRLQVTKCPGSPPERLSASEASVRITHTFFRQTTPVTARKSAASPAITHARSTGGKNARPFSISMRQRGQSLRDLSGTVWPHPVLLLANGPLLQKVRRPFQSSSGGRP